MFALKTHSWPSWALFVLLAVGLVTGQDSTPASHTPDAAQQAPSSAPSKQFDEFVDLAIRQESRLTELMRGFKPIIETYIQEEGSEHRAQRGVIPNGDDYFLSRLDLTENSLSLTPLADEETWNQGAEKNFVHVYDELPFKQAAFAQSLFPDFGNFDRQNYSFEFVRWEDLGEVHCAAIDVTPHGDSKKRGFVGRIWVEDRNHSIVRFKGTFTSRGLAKRAFHFDSWRLNTLGDWWLPAYVYTEEWKDLASHQLWFRAQTRVWNYDVRIAGDLQFSEGLRMDGHVKGNVSGVPGSQTLLVLSDRGSIEGNVHGYDVVVNGRIIGDLIADHFVELQGNAHVTGNIYYQQLRMDCGASVDGKLTKRETVQAVQGSSPLLMAADEVLREER